MHDQNYFYEFFILHQNWNGIFSVYFTAVPRSFLCNNLFSIFFAAFSVFHRNFNLFVDSFDAYDVYDVFDTAYCCLSKTFMFFYAHHLQFRLDNNLDTYISKALPFPSKSFSECEKIWIKLFERDFYFDRIMQEISSVFMFWDKELIKSLWEHEEVFIEIFWWKEK